LPNLLKTLDSLALTLGHIELLMIHIHTPTTLSFLQDLRVMPFSPQHVTSPSVLICTLESLKFWVLMEQDIEFMSNLWRQRLHKDLHSPTIHRFNTWKNGVLPMETDVAPSKN